MNCQTKPKDLPTVSLEHAARLLGEHVGYRLNWPDDLQYFAWAEAFSSTAGPFGGIGGQTICTFTMEAYKYGGLTAIFCRGNFLRFTNEFVFKCEWREKK